jgi:rhodanese-related sulfurtransferase
MKRLYVLVFGILFILCGMATVKADITPVPDYEYQDITPEQAYEMVENPTSFDYPLGTVAYILDVRTPAEWNWVGHPGKDKCNNGAILEGKVINIPFKLWVFDSKTKQYVEELNKFFDEEVVRQFSPDDIIIIMCRSGSRSVSASKELDDPDPTHPAYKRLEELGFYNIYNMLEGFEGGTDSCGYRELVNKGWKNRGLPYNYSTDGIWTPRQEGRSLGN